MEVFMKRLRRASKKPPDPRVGESGDGRGALVALRTLVGPTPAPIGRSLSEPVRETEPLAEEGEEVALESVHRMVNGQEVPEALTPSNWMMPIGALLGQQITIINHDGVFRCADRRVNGCDGPLFREELAPENDDDQHR